MTADGSTATANCRGLAVADAPAVVPVGAAAPEAGGAGNAKALIGAGAASGLPPLAATLPSKASTTDPTSASRPLVSMSATVVSMPSDRSITARAISPPAIFSTSSRVISSVPRSGSAEVLPCCRRPSRKVLMSGS